MAQSLKLQRKTEKTAAKEHRLNYDVNDLRGLLVQVLEMNARGGGSDDGGRRVVSDMTGAIGRIDVEKNSASQAQELKLDAADCIPVLIDQTEDFYSLERPFRPEVVENFTKMTKTGATI